MPNLQIVPLTETIKLSRNQGDAVFTLTNSDPRAMSWNLSARSKDPAVEEWLQLKGAIARTIPSGGVEQVAVAIAPPANAPFGTYSFWLRAAWVENPDENWQDSQSVKFELVDLKPPPPNYKLLIGIAAAVVALVVAVVIWIVTPPGKARVHEACSTNTLCQDHLECVPQGTYSTCLLRLGEDCSDGVECASLSCIGETCVLPELGFGCRTSCAEGLDCIQSVCQAPVQADPNAVAVRELWVAIPESPDPSCNLDYDFQPPGIRSIYCRLIQKLSYAVFAARLSMPIYLNRAKDAPLRLGERQFGRYNPEFVTWLVQNGVPGAADPAIRAVSQPMYDRYLRVAARLFYYSKRMIDESGRRDRFLRAFNELLVNPHSPSAQQDLRYFDLIPQEMYEEPIARICGIAMLFWIRRAVDGTEPQFYEGIQKVLRTYDADWLRQAENTPVTGLRGYARTWFPVQ